MHVSAVWRRAHRWARLCGLALAVPLAGEALAEPPPWAAERGVEARPAAPTAQQARRAADADDFVPASAIMFPRIDLGVCHREVLGSLVAGAGARPVAAGPAAAPLVGGAIGRSMDRLDHGCVGQVLEHAPTGRAVGWRNPERSAAYRVTALRTYEIAAGQHCREFRATATLAGRAEHAYGTACRQPGGDWRAVD
jgi:surface antigen